MKKLLGILVLGLLWCNTSQAAVLERYICQDTDRKGFFTLWPGGKINHGYLRIVKDSFGYIYFDVEYNGLYMINTELSSKSILVHVNTNEDFTTMIKFNKNTLEGFISEVPVNQDYDFFIKFKCR
jgi:hypothetical protein